MRWPDDADGWPLREASRIIPCGPQRWHVQAAGDGPTVLLIHGAGGATQSWRGLFPLLSQSHRVIAMDLPGQGFTQTRARTRFGLTAMTEDLAALVAQEGWQPRTVIGHSAGCAIALQGALADHWPGVRIVGINAALQSFQGLAGWLFPVFAKVLAANPLTAPMVSTFGATEGTVRRLLSGTGSKPDQTSIQLYQRLLADRPHVAGTLAMMAQWDLEPLIAALPTITAQTHLLAGEKDRTVPAHVSETAARQLPNGTFKPLPGLGHLAHEEAPQTIAAEFAELLSLT